MRYLAACLLVLAGCRAMDEPYLRRTAAPFLDCPADAIQITDYQLGAADMTPTRYTASGCGQRRFCAAYGGHGPGAGRVECRKFGE